MLSNKTKARQVLAPVASALKAVVVVPVGETKNLKRGTSTTYVPARASSKFPLSLQFGSRVNGPVPYPKFVHEGTSPYVIVPKRSNPKGMLTWLDKNYGWVSKPFVNHPGIKANPYLAKALKAVLGNRISRF